MFSVFGMCFNWKVLAGIGVVVVGILFVAPSLVLGALPLLLLAACPLSMLFMMKGGHGHGGMTHGSHEQSTPPSKESLEQQLQALAEEQRKLQSAIRQLESDPVARPTESVVEIGSQEAHA